MRMIRNNIIGKCSFLVCFSICMMFVSTFYSLSVKAEENNNIIDFSRRGTIAITLSEDVENTKVSGALITIYKIASAMEEDNNLKFSYNEDLNSCQEELDSGNITDEVLSCVMESGIVSIGASTDIDGMVKFNDLELGLYLVTQTNQVDGYSKIAPFLVMVPQVYDNSWIYDVEAIPKVDIIKLFDLNVEKVWNVGVGVKVPESVVIELFKGDKIIDEVTLNEKNNWTYTWKQIEKSDEYSVNEKRVPDGYVVTYSKKNNKFIVTNTKSLLQTGRSIWGVPMLAVIGLLFVVFGLVLIKRKSYE